MKKKTAILITFLYIISNFSLAQNIVLKETDSIVDIGKEVLFFIDSTNTCNITQVLNMPNNGFIKNTLDVPNFSNTKSSIWCKFTINVKQKANWWIELGNPLIDTVEFYQSNVNSYNLRRTGALLPYTTREVKTNLFLFQLTTDKDTIDNVTFYFKLRSNFPIQVPLKISTLKPFLEEKHRTDIGMGLYMGIMFVMVFYNLFIWIVTRDITYFYYINYALFITLLYVNFKGYSFEFLWPAKPYLNYYVPSISNIAAIFVILFATSFLHTKQHLPKFHKFSYFLYFVFFVSSLLNILGNYEVSSNLSQPFTLIMALYLLIVNIILLKKGIKIARFYFLAWSIYLTGVIIYILTLNSVIPTNVFTNNSILFGSALEVVLLSFALADKINVLKKEKEATQAQLLSSLQENDRIIREQNRILEERVTERTFQLQEANEELNQTVEELNATNETLNRINIQVADQNKEIEAKNVELNEVLQELNATNEELTSTNDALVNANEEIESQREAVAKAYENIKVLTIIGQKITQTLDLKEIIKMVYENVNELMDASGFGLGVYNAKLQELAFDGFMEKGKELPFHFHSTKEENYLAVWCFRRKQAIFINDVATELKNYIDKDIDSMKISTGEIPQSLLYIPLLHEEEVIGVITVQSFEKNAYTQTHFDLLQNLASYCSIAVANANTYQELDAKNANITKSIEYARTIQYAVLPKQTDIAASFADHFILYKPKDIVSGDFYWYRRTEQFTFFAVSDCTGHGVPGAFMSMIGNAILQDAIDRQQIYSPAAILEFIHLEVRNYLKKDDNTTSDGMDIALCMFEGLGTATIKTTFAAAKRNIYIAYANTQTVEELKGDRTMIGTPEVVGRKPFTNKALLLNKGDKLYLFSDGYGDQPNSKRSRFGTTAFKQIIDENFQFRMESQKQVFIDRLNAFQEKEEQRDDITVVGLEL